MIETRHLALLCGLCVALSVTAPAQEDGKKPAEPREPKTLRLGMRVDQDVALKDIDGKEYRAGSFMGKVTVVNFYSIRCPVQAGWDARFSAIQEKYGEEGVVFLNIASNHNEIDDGEAEEGGKPFQKLRSHLEEKELPYTVLVDHGNEVADMFGAQTTPHVFVFARNGRLVYRGLIDDDPRGRGGDGVKHHLRDVLDSLLAGEEVESYQTRPIGCTIKRVSKAGNGGDR